MQFKFLFIAGALSALLCSNACRGISPVAAPPAQEGPPVQPTPARQISYEAPLLRELVAAAVDRTNYTVEYDPSYFKIDYPNGDVPEGRGVCTDEVIRAYRAVGIDLQKEVHEDMRDNFRLYPTKFGLTKPDPNIDHRRVPNLLVFFERKAKVLPITDKAADYLPGDVITWDLGAGQTHIGLMVDVPSAAAPERFLIMHNIGAGPRLEDVLFNWRITGHFRYTGEEATAQAKDEREIQRRQ